MVFQEQSIFPWMSVRDNIAFGLKARGFSKRSATRWSEPFIHKVGLTSFDRRVAPPVAWWDEAAG